MFNPWDQHRKNSRLQNQPVKNIENLILRSQKWFIHFNLFSLASNYDFRNELIMQALVVCMKKLAFCSKISATTLVSTFRTLLSNINICRGVNQTEYIWYHQMEARTQWGSANKGENVFQFHGDRLNMLVMIVSFYIFIVGILTY